ncbi:MAG: 4Fe-4S binding protein [Eubacterium sp.]
MACFITEKCIGCTLCAKNCPVMAITGVKKEQHIINTKRCIDCGVCGRLCPQEAIIDHRGNMTVKVPKTKWLKPVVDQGLCSACSMCVDSCRFECLTLSMPAFKGDLRVFATLEKQKACVGCGYCEQLCPMKAISMEVIL